MEKTKLEVGDELYYYKEFSKEKSYAGKIDRVTKTMAFIKNEKISRNGNGSFKSIGDGDLEAVRYYVVTPEIKQEIIAQQKRKRLENRFISKFVNNIYDAVSRLSLEKLTKIVEILESEDEYR